ncbi:MAG: hypothetical protein PHS14_08275 [Elusimicrobia bacterium]|nr:hypothetical protein [Elusimicrobiota bacterium]
MTRPRLAARSAAAKKAARSRKRMAEAKAKREEKIVSRDEPNEGKAS